MVSIYWSIYATVGKYNGNLEVVDMHVSLAPNPTPSKLKWGGGDAGIVVEVLLIENSLHKEWTRINMKPLSE